MHFFQLYSFLFLFSPNVRESRFRNPEKFCCEIRNPGLWKPEYGLKNPESTFHRQRIRNPGYFSLVESGIQQTFALETGILGFGAQGTRNLTNN